MLIDNACIIYHVASSVVFYKYQNLQATKEKQNQTYNYTFATVEYTLNISINSLLHIPRDTKCGIKKRNFKLQILKMLKLVLSRCCRQYSTSVGDDLSKLTVLGYSLKSQNQLDKAAEVFNTILTQYPDNPSIRYALASTYEDMGPAYYKHAIDQFEKTRPSEELENALLHYRLAILHKQTGQLDSMKTSAYIALKYFRKRKQQLARQREELLELGHTFENELLIKENRGEYNRTMEDEYDSEDFSTPLLNIQEQYNLYDQIEKQLL